MDNKTIGFLLLGAAGVVAYMAFSGNGNSYRPPSNLPPGSQPILPGQSWGGVVNSSSDAIWLTATGQLINSLGQAFSNIYSAVQSNPSTQPTAPGPVYGPGY